MIPILYHYEASPFAELVRAAFGVKGLTWGSLLVPRIMPKPDQTTDQFVAALAAHRAELARIEDTWFDNVKAGVQGVDAASLAHRGAALVAFGTLATTMDRGSIREGIDSMIKEELDHKLESVDE